MSTKLTPVIAPLVLFGALALTSVAIAQQSPPPSPAAPSGQGMMQGGKMSGMGGGDMQQMKENCQQMMKDGTMANMSGDMKEMMDKCRAMMQQPSSGSSNSGTPTPDKKD